MLKPEELFMLSESKLDSISTDELNKKYRGWYNQLYDNGNNHGEYYNALYAFDRFSRSHKRFIQKFIRATRDLITSDRECAAFMLALRDVACGNGG